MVSTLSSFESQHEDIIHDAQVDYYGRRLATCSSDKTIRIFEMEGERQNLLGVLRGHTGPVWQVGWAHPKFGSILASCSYDSDVLIWGESQGKWNILYKHVTHDASVNSITWAPHDYGLMLACASSDGRISIVSFNENKEWDVLQVIENAHAVGCNSVSWAPANSPVLVPSNSGAKSVGSSPWKRFVSGGCDNLIKIWRYDEAKNMWEVEENGILEGHSDWVRDVAWAQNLGVNVSTIASCSQDKTVIIWTQDQPNSKWVQTYLQKDKFPEVVWRVSWSVTGTILAVSAGDGRVTLWKESLEGNWEYINGLEQSTPTASS